MTRTSILRPPVLTSEKSVLLDFDGTLVDIAARPDAVVIDPALPHLIGCLAHAFSGRIAIVSGRSVAQLAAFLPRSVDTIALIGSHGAEVSLKGRQSTLSASPEIDKAERNIRSQLAGLPGVLIEVKTLGVAVHYRLAPEREEAVRVVVNRQAAISGLVIQEGKMVLELRLAGEDKGTGITTLMAEPPFKGTVPVFAGDDVTDEAGFAAVARLGGYGVLVGPDRPTAARYRLPDVASVRRWLEQMP